jgi:3-hydroxyisobutyrate dehydrogenase-like beta-hydroxyacid dehydrogenase
MKAGFIGLGRMGQVMASRLIAAGHELTVYNRTPAKLAPLTALGAHPAASIAEAARFGGVVITMVTDDAALRAVAEEKGGLLEALPAGGIHLAMGTHRVQQIQALAEAHAAAGQVLLSAPVLGRPEAVTAGRLGVMVAGDASAVARCRPLLDALARRVFEAGNDPRAAAAMKLANNMLLGCAIAAMGEAFSLAQKCGADGSVFYDVITDGLFAAPAYTIYGRMIADKAWDKVGFTVALGLKDVELALEAGHGAAVPLPSANVCRDRLIGAIAHGNEQRDWCVMALEQARASGLE